MVSVFTPEAGEFISIQGKLGVLKEGCSKFIPILEGRWGMYSHKWDRGGFIPIQAGKMLMVDLFLNMEVDGYWAGFPLLIPDQLGPYRTIS